MGKNLILMNYANELADTGFSLDNIDNILRIDITVISGDEIATIIFENGDIKEFDSSYIVDNPRFANFHDAKYCIYRKGLYNNIERFNNRKDSYDYFYDYEEVE